MSRPLTELERDLLDVLAHDRADVAARAGLAELWARHGDRDHAALLRPLAAGPGRDQTAAIEARLRAPLERAGYAASDLAFAGGLLVDPIAFAGAGPLDGDPDIARISPRSYRVVRRLAYGTTAMIDEAEAVTPRSTARVVLKVPHAAGYDRVVLARERARLATLTHPHLSRGLGAVLHPDGPGHALAHAGVDLRGVLAAARERGASLGAGFAIAVAVQACDALAALHAAGVVHGEIRPEHLVVSAAGLLTVVGLGHDHNAQIVGEPLDPEGPVDDEMTRMFRYLAPEQIRGERVDGATDVWATAIVASELFTGDHPIPAPVIERHDIAMGVLAGVEPPPSFPSTIRDALRRVLDRDPGRRPTPTALRTALVEAAAAAGLEIGAAVIARGLAALAPPEPDRHRHAPPAPADPPAPTAAGTPGGRCWCVHLAAGLKPDAPTDAIAAYVRNQLAREQSLFATTEHFGDVDLRRCDLCGGAVLHLLIEHEGFTGSIHHYYTPLTTTDEDALAAGTLNGASYEDWAGDRCGIHVTGGRATLYRRARIGYLGLGHRLLD